MYCIMCEKEVRVFRGAITGDFHLYAVPLPDGMVGVEDCDGPFAYCPPPEIPNDFDAPSEEELKTAEEIKMNGVRRFRFLGHGDRQVFNPDDDSRGYGDMNPDTHYWYRTGNWTVGKVYEMVGKITTYDDDVSADALFVDDTGQSYHEELQFFEEVFE